MLTIIIKCIKSINMDIFNYIPLLKKYDYVGNEYNIANLNNQLENSKKHIKLDRFSLYYHIEQLTRYDQNCGTTINICHEFENICKELCTGQKSDFIPNIYENPNIFEYIPILNKYNSRVNEYHLRNLSRILFWAANVNKYGDDYFFRNVTDMNDIHWKISHHIDQLMKYYENCSTIINTCHDFESICHKLQNKPYEKKQYHYDEINIFEEFPELKKYCNDPNNFYIRNLEKIVFKFVNNYIDSNDVFFQNIFISEYDIKHLEYHVFNLCKIEEKYKISLEIRNFCENYKRSIVIDNNFCFDFDRKIDMTICI